MAEAKDRAKKGDVLGVVCMVCAKKLVTTRFRFCATDTISRERKIEIWEADTQKNVEDVVVTKEPTTEMVQSIEISLVADIQEPLANMAITQELAVKT